jgi:transcriptional regulator with XRE-family HTH domain
MVNSRIKVISNQEYQIMIAFLRENRKRKGTTQLELASRLGAQQSDVSKIERGERRIDLIETLAICRALEIDIHEFITELESRTKRLGCS